MNAAARKPAAQPAGHPYPEFQDTLDWLAADPEAGNDQAQEDDGADANAVRIFHESLHHDTQSRSATALDWAVTGLPFHVRRHLIDMDQRLHASEAIARLIVAEVQAQGAGRGVLGLNVLEGLALASQALAGDAVHRLYDVHEAAEKQA